MDYLGQILGIAEENKGIITSSKVTELKIPRVYLTKLKDSGKLQKIDTGIYAMPEVWEDEFFVLQTRYSAGVFSHDSALFLNGYTDRTPAIITMTFPYGYHAKTLKGRIIIKKANPDLYETGIQTVVTPAGHAVRVYSIERTLCDIFRGKNANDVEQNLPALKKYINSPARNIAQLLEYADKFRVISRMRRYLEVLI